MTTKVKETWQEREAREVKEVEDFNLALGRVVSQLPVLMLDWSVNLVKSDYRFQGNHAEFSYPDGRKFDIYPMQGEPTRFVISGTYPRDNRGELHFPYGVDRPSITVSASRSVEAIVQAIKSRFLPEYDAIFATMKASNDKNNAYVSKRYALTAEFAKLVGKKIDPEEKFGNRFHDLSFEMGGHYHEFNAGENTVDLKLSSLTPEMAKKVLALIKGE
jgi:hypothetical protein